MNAPLATQADPKTEQEADLISLPRWIVYFQGGLLGVVAATFFIFGLLVGSVTHSQSSATELVADCRVSGDVLVESERGDLPDEGAVVILLPVDAKPMERVNPNLLNPSRFQPLENPAVSLVHEMGGAVTRVDERGRFEFVVDSPQSYHLIVISKFRMQVQPKPLRKDQKAILATFFLPFENLIGEHEFAFSQIQATGDSQKISPVTF